jgi:hypothetical protein
MTGKASLFRFSVVVFFLLQAGILAGQNKYWILFEDKDGVEFNPYEYFDQWVMERREATGIRLVKFCDLP